jgi:hypothetical protein
VPAQVLRSQPATLSATFTDTSGATVDPGVVTVTITRLDGTALVTDAATSGSGAAARTYTLTAAQTGTLDTLTATFTSASLSATAVSVAEIVGAYLFTEAEARAFDGAAMASDTLYPDAAIQEARARITDQFETICNVSFVPRYRLDTFSGSGYTTLPLMRFKVTDIRSVEYRTLGSVTWTAYDADDLADLFIENYGDLLRETRGTFVTGRRNIRIGYEHGFTTPPYDIKQAALLALKYEIANKNYGDRTISMSNEFGSEQYWTPGISGRGTAIHPLPEVDRILKLYDFKVPVVA